MNGSVIHGGRGEQIKMSKIGAKKLKVEVRRSFYHIN